MYCNNITTVNLSQIVIAFYKQDHTVTETMKAIVISGLPVNTI